MQEDIIKALAPVAERKIWARELQVQYNASVVKCCDVVGIITFTITGEIDR